MNRAVAQTGSVAGHRLSHTVSPLTRLDRRHVSAQDLLDLTDEFTITHVGVYNARYAHHMQWPLQDLLEELAGHHVDLEAERAAFRTLLLSGVEVRRA